MADVPESFWDNLLDYIQEGTVVPVIGSELATVREGEQDVPLDCWLARRLAADLGLTIAELPAGFALNEVVALHLRRRGEREPQAPFDSRTDCRLVAKIASPCARLTPCHLPIP